MESLIMHAGYLLALVPVVLIWIYVFFFKYFKSRNRVRIDMLLVGLLAGIASVLLAPKFWVVYWNPPYIFGHSFYFEEFLYGFFYGGLASEFSEILEFTKVTSHRKKIRGAKYCVLIGIFLLFVLYLFIRQFHHLNPIYLLCLFIFFYSLVMFTVRSDLFVPSLINASTFAIFTFIWYLLIISVYPEFFSKFWNFSTLSNIKILTIPIEEFVFSFLLGLTAGPSYELLMGFKEGLSRRLIKI